MIRLAYIFDPLCGWCYGASPRIAEIMLREDIEVELLPCGLFAGEGAFRMNPGFAAHVLEADQRIADLSGQPFSDIYRRQVLGNAGSRIDSGAATLALTAVHLTEPAREFETLTAIQRARYVDGRDNAESAVILDILKNLGLETAAARFDADDPGLKSNNHQRIEIGRSLLQDFGAGGVPALIVGTGDNRVLLSAMDLFGDLETLVNQLKANADAGKP